jgi:hypothetical protein
LHRSLTRRTFKLAGKLGRLFRAKRKRRGRPWKKGEFMQILLIFAGLMVIRFLEFWNTLSSVIAGF